MFTPRRTDLYSGDMFHLQSARGRTGVAVNFTARDMNFYRPRSRSESCRTDVAYAKIGMGTFYDTKRARVIRK